MDLTVKYAARFRDAIFYFTDSAPTTGGRKTITREFPGSDRRYVEDMGLLNKTFEISAIVTTEEEKDKLIKALETPGIGQLSHPTFGLINVTAQPYTVIDSIYNLGYCTFNLKFEVSQENIYPEVTVSNISYLQSKVSFLDNSIVANFAKKLNINPNTLQSAIQTSTQIINTYDKVCQSVDEAREIILTAKKDVVQLIQEPVKFINSMKATIKSVTTFVSDPKSAFKLLTGMFSSSKKNQSTATSAVAKQREITSNTIIQATNSLVLAECYDLINQMEFDNNEELELTRDTVEALYNDLIDNPTDFLVEVPETYLEVEEEVDLENLSSTSVLENMQEVRQLSNNILSEKENTVARIVEISTNETTLNDIVFSYYGNLNNLDKIESINNIEDRSVVSGTLRVLSE